MRVHRVGGWPETPPKSPLGPGRARRQPVRAKIRRRLALGVRRQHTGETPERRVTEGQNIGARQGEEVAYSNVRREIHRGQRIEAGEGRAHHFRAVGRHVKPCTGRARQLGFDPGDIPIQRYGRELRDGGVNRIDQIPTPVVNGNDPWSCRYRVSG